MATIPLRQIRAVIAVCEEGSFTRAAQRENATQSGISQHVAAVERTLKVKLFERTTGGVTPTPAGLRYYKRCVEAVGALEHVVGFDTNPARRREASRAGVEIAQNAVQLAAAVPTILTSLPKPEALADTARKIAAAKLKRKLLVEMSTFKISDKEKTAAVLRKAGHQMIDCPVSGTGAQAKNRDLVFYASGDSKLIAKIRRLLSAFGRGVFNVGPFGNGSRMGSLGGAAIGALLVGLADNFGKALFPELAYFTLYAPMVLILAIKPTGLFGRD